MSHNLVKVKLAFWDKAVQAFKASSIALPVFFKTQDEEDKRLVKESRWQFQPVRLQQDVSSLNGLAFRVPHLFREAS